MAWSVEKIGESVEAAVQLALQELNLREDEVEVEVLEQGGQQTPDGTVRPARVLVTPLDDSQGTYYGDMDDSVESGINSETAERTREFLESILENFETQYALHLEETDEGLNLDVQSPDCAYLIGRGGETLSALQYLTSLVGNRNSDQVCHVRVDVGGYRKQHEESLASLAKRTALKVAQSGRVFEMRPMSPADRRVVHAALQGMEGICTYSEGEGEARRVLIAPLNHAD